jgi:hypothetical protein
MKLKLLVVLLAFASNAFAGEVSIECSSLPERVDGSPFPRVGVTFSYSDVEGQYSKNWDRSISANSNDCTVKITGLTTGKTYYFVAKAYTLSKAEFSLVSDAVSRVAKDPEPAKGVAPVIK